MTDRPMGPPASSVGEGPPKVAIVIDDLGWQTESARYFEQLQQPITMAVLPSRPYSKELYNRFKNKFEFIVHMPMEPKGYPGDDPGKSALMTSMTSAEVKEKLRSVLQTYPDVRGINNHMGSAFTADQDGMNNVMSVLAPRGMYYLDSKTSASSVAVSTARKHGVPVLTNDVFLDHTNRDYSTIRNQFEKTIQTARSNGFAIAIGHFQSTVTGKVLQDLMPRYADRGIEFVTLSRLVRRVSPN
ncbi:MAG: divergent polysaccharide deacetylase family protein [bacterium]